MSVLPVGFGSAVAGGYQIERSLRFNSADTAYLSRTPGSTGNRRTFTFSFWIKRTTIGTNQRIIQSQDDGTTVANTFAIYFPTDSLEIFDYSSAYRLRLLTTQVFRDVSAWYHIVVAIDTTQATASNRAKLYVNGSQVTTFSATTYPSQNTDLFWNVSGQPSFIGRFFDGASAFAYLNAYLTEVNFINGQALTPSDFGETDASTGVWKPKAYSGTYGTNGFYLKFADNSGTTSTTLGKDSSGNGNNWTPNNFSVTAGVGNDSLVDTPTAYGTDTGVGGEVRGNYSTMNPLDNVITLSNGNLQAVGGSGTAFNTRGTFWFNIALSDGWYWEFTSISGSGSEGCVGIAPSTYSINNTSSPTLTSNTKVYCPSGNKNYSTAYGSSWTNNDVIGVAVKNGKIWYAKNGTWQASGNPATEANPADSGLTGFYAAFMYSATSGVGGHFNFGQRPFAYTAPSGFKALCTQNLPTPTIGATSTTQANDYMNVVTWAGNNVTPRTISGLDFQPDFVWLKDRTVAHNNYLYDAVRGAGNNSELSSNSTGQEGSLGASEYGYVSAFTSNGFTLTGGTDPTYYMADVNYPGSNFVGWNWKANGAGSTNSNGTAKSSSVTVDSGTDTVTWNSHGMSDGQKIGFFATTMPGGLSAGTLYYVRDAATNTFKVAASSGGAAIDITSNGTTVTAHTTLTSTVSANTTAGFSIVTYTGTGANATVEHGLGKVPMMVVLMRRSGTAASYHIVWHKSLGAGTGAGTEYLGLNVNNAAGWGGSTNMWSSTAPSTTVFSLGSVNNNNASGQDNVAYCFAEIAGFSKFGSYTGNGSPDGPFVYTDFRPRFLMIKSTSTGSWLMLDTARSTFNIVSPYLTADNSGVEGWAGAFDWLDITANGFKHRNTGSWHNTNGVAYIYAAFAESPFKYSLAR